MTNLRYDVLVVGAGAAGSTASSTARKRGAHVGLIERDQIGGTCLNYGCDPTRTLLHIAGILQQARCSTSYEIHFSGIDYDWNAVQAYTQKVMNQMRGGTSDQASKHLQQQGMKVTKGERHTSGSKPDLSCDDILVGMPPGKVSICGSEAAPIAWRCRKFRIKLQRCV